MFRAQGLRHPSAGLHLAAGACFVPNDVQLGGGAPAFIVLTGPNMGGAPVLLPWRSSLSLTHLAPERQLL